MTSQIHEDSLLSPQSLMPEKKQNNALIVSVVKHKMISSQQL